MVINDNQDLKLNEKRLVNASKEENSQFSIINAESVQRKINGIEL